MSRKEVPDSTELTIFVRTSKDEVVQWNRQKIIDALMLETDVDPETAQSISREVEKQIFSSGIETLTASLIRELVDAKLIERGMEQDRRMHARLGFPVFDVGRIMIHPNRGNANVPHWPEATNLTLAGGIKREYALHKVFSTEVAEAHLAGDLHLHDLGFIDRPYSAAQSLEYIKKFGLNLPDIPSFAKPARHAEVLLAHMVRFSAALQGIFSGPIEWCDLNILFAPYLCGIEDAAVRQLAQLLVFEFSQLASARGGQVMYTNLHLYWDIPGRLQKTPAIGPGGEFTGKNYEDYSGEARRFACAILETFLEGDATGRPFSFPKPLVHITEAFFNTPGHADFLHLACRAAAEKGNPFFVFDRRGSGKEERSAEPPWETRSAAIHQVSLNLPRLGYKAAGSDGKLFSLLSGLIETAVRAHSQKKKFLEELLSYGKEGPLSFLLMNKDGLPYLRHDRSTYLIGMVGLSELVHIHKGSPIVQSESALAFGLKVLEQIRTLTDNLGRQYGMNFELCQLPVETTAYRFARLDLKDYSPAAGRHVKGDLLSGGIYYTSSTPIELSNPITPMERIRKEGIFHHFMTGGALTQLWTGEIRPPEQVLSEIVTRTFRETNNRQITFSPEFTGCGDCGKVTRGMHSKCPACGSEKIDGISKVTGYFAKTSSLNRGKLSEFRNACRHDLKQN